MVLILTLSHNCEYLIIYTFYVKIMIYQNMIFMWQKQASIDFTIFL